MKRKKPVDPNASKALEDLKLEISYDLGIEYYKDNENHQAKDVFNFDSDKNNKKSKKE